MWVWLKVKKETFHKANDIFENRVKMKPKALSEHYQ